MTDNIAKREEARQVWRLNQKEGVPVLEALETANISKDTYYSYKNEYEDEWEDQLLTVQEIDEELEKLSDELSDIREMADKVEGRLEGVDEIGQKMDRIERARSDWLDVDDRFRNYGERLDALERELGVDFNPEKDGPPMTVEDVDKRVSGVEKHVSDLEDRLNDIEMKMGNIEKAHKSDMRKVWKDVHRAANSGLFASDSVLNHNL